MPKVNLVNDETLIGSCIFFSSNTPVSFIVRLAGFLDRKRGAKLEQWSHVGTIILKEDGRLGLLEALSPTVVINDLEERINSTNEKIILCRLTSDNRKKIKNNIPLLNALVNKYNGLKYNYIGAILAGIDLTKYHRIISAVAAIFKSPTHCSHISSEIYKQLGIYGEDIIPREMTPQDMFETTIFKERILLK